MTNEQIEAVAVTQADIRYLVKLADWAAGQGFCQIEGMEDPDEWCFRIWEALGPEDGNGYSADALADRFIAAMPNHKAAMIEGARLALEAAANGLEAYAKAYTEMKEAAKGAKDKREVRDFQTMAMTCAFRSAEIRALDPAQIAGGADD